MTACIYMGNAFSLQMMSADEPHQIRTWPMTIGSVREFWRDRVPVVSAIGHADTARMLIVAQIFGGRLPEGATSLPEGFDLRFVGVKVES